MAQAIELPQAIELSQATELPGFGHAILNLRRPRANRQPGRVGMSHSVSSLGAQVHAPTPRHCRHNFQTPDFTEGHVPPHLHGHGRAARARDYIPYYLAIQKMRGTEHAKPAA